MKTLGNAAIVSKGLDIKSIKELSDEWIKLTKLKKNRIQELENENRLLHDKFNYFKIR